MVDAKGHERDDYDDPTSPDGLGGMGKGLEQISEGLGEFTDSARAHVSKRAKVSPVLSELWFERSFGPESERIAEIA
ncbi:MAG: hypothetical protein AAGH17_10795 [Pseudomonadota bacterium]